MIEFFIDVARECFNIGNFNSLMAIICEFPFCHLCGHRLCEVLLLMKQSSLHSWDEHESCVTSKEDLGESQNCQVLHPRGKFQPLTWPIQKQKCGHETLMLMSLALTASDGSHWKLLQLQDRPAGGRPSLSDRQQ